MRRLPMTSARAARLRTELDRLRVRGAPAQSFEAIAEGAPAATLKE